MTDLPLSKALLCLSLLFILLLACQNANSNHPKKEKDQTGNSQGDYNHLKNAQSPYLRLHADNPVHWYPWGEKAFQKAKKEDKPIFLSIGYSTCHWCHVMEKESFEDPQVAKLMNEAFVNIKVDREQRPDIDNTYMKAAHMLGRRGGWPLTIIMTPEKKPFFAATYIPKKSHGGHPGMLELIPRIQKVWKNQRERIESQASRVASALSQTNRGSRGRALGKKILETAFSHLAKNYDEKYGAFRKSPKFPSPHNFYFLLRHWKRTGDSRALAMVENTLQHMRRGGIYDHIGYGFHRYSTDRQWLLPHFEKMLYDQALISLAYLEAYQATKKDIYRETAEEIFRYVLRDMTSPQGGFYSAQGADSEGEEGRFYVWSTEEVRKVLDKKLAPLVIDVYNLTNEGNYREEASGKRTGHNIFHLQSPLEEIARKKKMSVKKLKISLAKARQKLFAHRKKRVHPLKDDKILTDWNGLMIAALARGGRVVGDEKYTRAAKKAYRFIEENLTGKKGRLLHRYREGKRGLKANLADYAYLIWASIELYETTFEVHYLEKALEYNQFMVKHFWDEKEGGLFFSPDYGENPLGRDKDMGDGARPSGNSVAMWNMLKLSRMTGEKKWEKKGAEIGQSISKRVRQHPTSFTMLLVGVDFYVGPTFEVVITGKKGGGDTEKMIGHLRNHFIPKKIVLFRPPGKNPKISQIAPYTKAQKPREGKATAYVCQNFTCKLPTTEMEKMLELLGVRGKEK